MGSKGKYVCNWLGIEDNPDLNLDLSFFKSDPEKGKEKGSMRKEIS